MDAADRKKEVLNACLDLFVEKGLSKTSTRDLSSAINLQRGGMYYYYSSKDELVVACADEAVQRIEKNLIAIALRELRTPAALMKQLQKKAIELAPTMKFFASVCSDRRYEEPIKPVLQRMGERYSKYCERFSDVLNCRLEEVAPYVHMCIIAISNYMIFEETSFVAPQIKAVQVKLERLLSNTVSMDIRRPNRETAPFAAEDNLNVIEPVPSVCGKSEDTLKKIKNL